jgi:hypothetical protein
MKFLSTIIQFMMSITKQYSYDESHGIIHGFNTLHTAYTIYEKEVGNYPELKGQEKIILVAAVIHDMCDKKYMDETDGITKIHNLFEHELKPYEITVVHDIITQMSYSKVKKNGFPELGKYQSAFNVVREADLLEAYDFDRAMIYHLHHRNSDVSKAYIESIELFENRMFMHETDGLFTFEYTKNKSRILKTQSMQRIKQWKKIIRLMNR